MKLAPVLARYLTTNKVLTLPGLGTFHANSAYDPNVDYSKKGTSLLDVSFEPAKTSEFDEELINYVASETGKMKILAKSDLMSEIDGAIHFLNTGKPYYISGIGTITKKINGNFEFSKEKHQTIEKEKKKRVPITERNSVPQAYIDENRKAKKTKPAIIILTLCLLAIAAVVWFYVKNTENDNGIVEEEVAANTEKQEPEINKDTTVLKQTTTDPSLSNAYKFVLEVAQQPRASKRYNQLKKINWPIEIESNDSVNYKLFIPVPIANADTLRIKDSLSRLSGKKVWIER